MVLKDPDGNTMTSLTDVTGSYRFDNVVIDKTYSLVPQLKGYSFTQQALVVNGSIESVNFVGTPTTRSRSRS